MKFRDRIKKYVSEIRRAHFNNVQRVFILFVKSDKFYMSVIPLPLGFGFLFIDKSCKKMPEDAIKALIAHELSHIELRHFIGNSEYQERAADKHIIKIGYGPHLLCFHQWHGKKYKKFKKSEGLTKKEIKSICKTNQR